MADPTALQLPPTVPLPSSPSHSPSPGTPRSPHHETFPSFQDTVLTAASAGGILAEEIDEGLVIGRVVSDFN